MKKDFFAFSVFLLIVLSCFSFFYLFPVLGSDSTMTIPSIKFKEWQVGRSDKGTDINKDEHKSFITTTQTSCHFRASVVYASDPSQNTSPIDPSTVVWSITGASHNMSLNKKTLKHNWSGSTPSQMASDTSFNVVGSITVPEVVGTRTVRYQKNGVWKTKKVPDYKSSTSCSANDKNRSKRRPVHRGGKKMKFNIKFSAQTEAKHKVEVVLVLEADDLDQIRQEYVDYNRTIPGRDDSKWTAENTYDFGHYKKMLDVGLATKMSDWVKEINKLRGTNKETGELIPAFKVSDFVLNSGYRNPHHNFDHANSTALLSPHMYGYALDVNGKKNPKDEDLDINADGKNTSADRALMTKAALPPNADARWTKVYSSSKHVHADWAPSGWASRSSAAAAPKMFTLPQQGTETPVSTTPETPETPSTPETVMHPCSVHETTVSGEHSRITPPCGDSSHAGYACQISHDHKTTISGWSGTFYECQPHTDYPCGHRDLAANAAYHAPKTCTQTNEHGDSCEATGLYECQSHTCMYPTPIIICARRPCNDVVSTAREHWVTCKAGHEHWGCHPWHENHHRMRTCRRTNCRQSWQRCSRPANDRTPDCLASPGKKCAAIQ